MTMDALRTLATAVGRVSLAELGAGSRSPAFAAGALAGWAIERRALRSRRLGKEVRAMVALKDALVVAGALSAIALRLLRRGRRAQRSVRLAHRAVLAAAVAATPLINFALFYDYRPEGARGLLKLWA
jgi:hypothetical protein